MNDNHAQDRLRELLDEDPLDSALELSEGTSEADQLVDQALTLVDLSVLSPEAQDLFMGLTETASSLEPMTRQRLVGAADRGMKRRREDASPLPRLLFLLRNREEQSAEMVAASLTVKDVEMDQKMLLAIERGECDIRILGAGGVVAWVQHFGVPNDLAIDALRAAFQATTVSDQASAATPSQLNAEQDKFINDVDELLNQS